MKYASLFLLTATVVAGSGQVHGQFVTGFNFNNIDSANNVGDFTANFGGTATGGNPERGYFTLYTGTAAYASDTDPYNSLISNTGTAWWQANDDLGGGAGRAADGNVHTARGSQAGLGAPPAPFTLGNVTDAGNALHFTGAVNGGFFSYGIDASGDGFAVIENLRVDFTSRALNSAFATTQNWWLIGPSNAGDIAQADFSSALNSGSFTPTTDYANWGFDLGDVNSGSFLVFGVATTNIDPFEVGPDTGILYDNVAFSGTAVIPEPSTYAVIVGLLAIGAAAWRRRTAR